MVAISLAAPFWSENVAKTTPYENRVSDQIVVDGKETDIVSPDGVPIGPTYGKEYFLGADSNGRDIMVRLLYGGRNSLLIGVAGRVDHDRCSRSPSAWLRATSGAGRTP